jgi:serine/threonine protein kinase
MGNVYLAEDPRLGRNLAIKLLPPELDRDAERRDRFISEAKAASALNHPNIITVYEIDQADGAYYLATEFIGGITLRERMGNVGMPVREVMDIAVQVAQGLAAAHAAGIVHRDIKPENVVLRSDGLAKIVDFGLAKIADTEVRQADLRTTMGLSSVPGPIVGTLGYMSPEQARGQDVDRRTDIFSLGSVLYEMLGGQPAFWGETPSDVMAAVLTAQPKPLRQLSPEIPPKLERMVNRMIAKNLEERYSSVTELLAELTAVRKEWELETERPRAVRRSTKQDVGKVKSLAVLPFVSASADDPEAEYLSDGLTESLTGLPVFLKT